MTEIRTTLGALVDAEAALATVLAVKFDREGGARVRYHVAKLAKLVEVETRHFFEERNALVTKYGEGEPKQIAPASPNWTAFSADHQALAAVPVTIPWGPITGAMLEPYADVTARELLALGPLFELDAFPLAPDALPAPR